MNNRAEELRMVVIGGGSGASMVLCGLKRHTSRLTAVVTMFDSGGSSGRLQEEFGYPPLGDLRQCLVGLSNDNVASKPLRDLIDFRFRPDSSLNGHSLGNLLLAALTTIGQDLERAIEQMGLLLGITGQVIPVALERADLCAELADGSLLRRESSIDLRRQRSPRIKQVFLEPTIPANPRAVKAILDAHVVVLGPGDLYTSIVPNLLVDGIAQALAETRATRIYICNLMTKLGETDEFKASSFVAEVLRYLNGPHLDWALINSQTVPDSICQVYASEYAAPVEADLSRVIDQVPGVLTADLSNHQVPLKHEPSRVAQAVLQIAQMGRPLPASVIAQNGTGQQSPAVDQDIDQGINENGRGMHENPEISESRRI